MTASNLTAHDDEEKKEKNGEETPGIEAGDYSKADDLDLQRVGDSPVIPDQQL